MEHLQTRQCNPWRLRRQIGRCVRRRVQTTVWPTCNGWAVLGSLFKAAAGGRRAPRSRGGTPLSPPVWQSRRPPAPSPNGSRPKPLPLFFWHRTPIHWFTLFLSTAHTARRPSSHTCIHTPGVAAVSNSAAMLFRRCTAATVSSKVSNIPSNIPSGMIYDSHQE